MSEYGIAGLAAGHVCPCLECRAASTERKRDWRARNPGREREYYQAHAERRRAACKTWRDRNQAYVRAQQAARYRRVRDDTRAAATRQGQAWTDDDDAVALRQDFAASELAYVLGRTSAAVSARRLRIRRSAPTP